MGTAVRLDLAVAEAMITYPCRHEVKEDCPACMQDEIERLRSQLGKAMELFRRIDAETDCDHAAVLAQGGLTLSDDQLP